MRINSGTPLKSNKEKLIGLQKGTFSSPCINGQVKGKICQRPTISDAFDSIAEKQTYSAQSTSTHKEVNEDNHFSGLALLEQLAAESPEKYNIDVQSNESLKSELERLKNEIRKEEEKHRRLTSHEADFSEPVMQNNAPRAPSFVAPPPPAPPSGLPSELQNTTIISAKLVFFHFLINYHAF